MEFNVSIEERIQHACAAYEKKYARKANRAYVPIKDVDGRAVAVEGVQVVGHRSILPKHVWVGVAEN